MKIIDFYFRFLYYMPRGFAHRCIYKHFKKERMNWSSPQKYDEKIHWLMANYYDESFGIYANKYAVREYVKNCGFENILIPLVGKGCYHSVDEIDFEELPDQFILKANHGSNSNYYVICSDKNDFAYEAAKKKMRNALLMKKQYAFCQYHYAGITPCIVAEKLLENDDGTRLTDYKVICSYGKPHYILVCNDRDNGRDYYNVDWEYMPFVFEKYRSGKREERPQVLEELLNTASVLSKPFPLARVDFYIVNHTLYFGEITLTPSAGIHKNLNEIGQIELGKTIILPQIS